MALVRVSAYLRQLNFYRRPLFQKIRGHVVHLAEIIRVWLGSFRGRTTYGIKTVNAGQSFRSSKLPAQGSFQHEDPQTVHVRRPAKLRTPTDGGTEIFQKCCTFVCTLTFACADRQFSSLSSAVRRWHSAQFASSESDTAMQDDERQPRLGSTSLHAPASVL